jgi:hypothetical protein
MTDENIDHWAAADISEEAANTAVELGSKRIAARLFERAAKHYEQAEAKARAERDHELEALAGDYAFHCKMQAEHLTAAE